MRSILFLIPTLLLFASCYKKQIQVKGGIDSVQYFAEQHAQAERSIKEANAIIDMILLDTKSAPTMDKEVSIADRLFRVRAAMKEEQQEKARLKRTLASLKDQASAYEMMAVALMDELEYRDHVAIPADKLDQRQINEPSSPATAKAEMIYINFPEK